MIDLSQLHEQVIPVAKAAGAYIREQFISFSDQHIEVKGLHDLVSYVDKTAEFRFVEELSKLLPRAGFIAEEGTNDRLNEFYNWVIDPLDGTTNYLHQLPIYCTSVALIHLEKPVLGVIYDPVHDECFYAWENGGAWLNGNSIQVSSKDSIRNSLIVMGFPYEFNNRLDDYLKIVKAFTLSSRGVRRLGSAALDLAYVASGRFDAFFEYGLQPWDVAAGALIVKEAGGSISDFSGSNKYIFGKEVITTTPRIYDKSLEIIRNNWTKIIS